MLSLASNLRAQAAIAPILASSAASGSNMARHLRFAQSCSFHLGTVCIKPPDLPEPSQMQSARTKPDAECQCQSGVTSNMATGLTRPDLLVTQP
jgi:hypothetical protein